MTTWLLKSSVKKLNCVADKTMLIITPIYEGELIDLEPFDEIVHV